VPAGLSRGRCAPASLSRHPCQPARGRPGRGAEGVSVANPSAARGTRPADPAAGGQAGDADGLVVHVDELEAALGGGRNRGGWVTFTRSLPPGPCAIYCALVPPKVLPEEATTPNSAAIVGTNLGIETNADANSGQFLPTTYSGVSGGGIASCSDRRTFARGSAVAPGSSIARSGFVPALASLGVAPLPHTTRRRLW
jgi:hypothetical protein